MKAVLLSKIAHYFEWPDESIFKKDKKAFIIGIYGNNSFEDILNDVYSKDNKKMLAGTVDGAIEVWDVETNRRLTIIDLQDDPLGAVFAVGGFVFALDDGESLHNVIHIIPLDAVEVEVGCIQFTAEEETPLFIPAEGWPTVAAVAGEIQQIPGCIS